MTSPLTRKDLREISESLGELVQSIDKLQTRHLRAPNLYEAGAPADADAIAIDSHELIQDLLASANLFFATAFDHIDLLVNFGISAARGDPTPTFPPAAVSRSAIEALAESFWLERDGIDASERAGRLLSIARRDVVSQEHLGMTVSESATAEIEADAERLGLKLDGRGWRKGYGAELPSLSTLVEAVTESKSAYSLLSAIAHGETWATYAFGYSPTETVSGVGTIAQKEPSVDGLALALRLAGLALMRAARADSRYRAREENAVEVAIRSAAGPLRVSL